MPKDSLVLTERDRAVLSSLTRSIRLILLEQVSQTWWSEAAFGTVAARARLERLEAAGLLVRRVFPMHPLLDLQHPIHAWRPGEVAPDFGAISYRLRKRWSAGTIPATAYIATKQAAKLMGGLPRGGKADGRLRHPLQATHDAHVAELFLRLLRAEPALAGQWISEEQIQARTPGTKASDGALVDGTGRIRLAIEFGGSYRPDRVQSFHHECVRNGLPYELW